MSILMSMMKVMHHIYSLLKWYLNDQHLFSLGIGFSFLKIFASRILVMSSTIEWVRNNFILSIVVVFITERSFFPFRAYTVYIYRIKGLLRKQYLFKETKKLFNNLPFPELFKCKPYFTQSNFQALFTVSIKSECKWLWIVRPETDMFFIP